MATTTELERKFENITGIEFRKFYKDNYESLKYHLANYTKNINTAEEITAVAFIRALDKIDTFDPSRKAQPHTWLTTIAVNMVRQDYRQKQKNQHISIDKNYGSDGDDDATLSAFLPSHDSRQDLEDQDIVLRKSNIIKEVIEFDLSPKYRRVMELRMIKNLPYKEVQEQLEREQNKTIPLSTVKSQIRKGKELVQEKVKTKFIELEKNGTNRYF